MVFNISKDMSARVCFVSKGGGQIFCSCKFLISFFFLINMNVVYLCKLNFNDFNIYFIYML